ncbi:polyketide synthase [Mycobacterium sp. 852013-50091_SCH5140682]|uniref:mycobactin polyketide synthase MbtD n=1 Tax=Mycobacterium sp. 852013-50091_SCH5140682 TaxID=1834109 RepID=UPI0007E995DF|nr:mycobactin polyketide synthase MbtD [Mycobacterium sp. 852013-50091_SCH5140682]OBC15823.1 polyketide synthase [Mycobacterium sp. 852013-50091_SCH5140682]
MSGLPDGRVPILLSAHAADLVEQDAAAILRYLDSQPAATPSEVAQTLLSTRRVRRHRAVVRAADRGELLDGLRALAAGQDHPLVDRSTGSAPHQGNTQHRVAFVFPGQGSQWPSMGLEAYADLTAYRAEADACAAVFCAAGAASPLDYLLAPAAADTNDFSQVQIQGAQFVHGVALARVWQSCGLLPDITVGHSLGEIGAAYLAGAVTLPEAVAIVIARATVLDRLTGPYRVAVLGIPAAAAHQVIAETPGWLELSVVNSRSSVAISGDASAVAAAVHTVTGTGSFAKEIAMWFPAHTTALDGVRLELESLLPAGEFADSAVQFIGSATADVVAAGTDFADYWYTNLRSPVRFDRAIGTAIRRGARVFVELSAHPALLFAMGDLLDDADLAGGPAVMVGSGRRDVPLTEQLSANIATAALTDPGFRWADLADAVKPLRDFPFAPMRAEHLWAHPQPLPPLPGLTVATEQWQELGAMPAVDGVRRAAVLDLGDGGPVSTLLRVAVDGSGAASPVAADDADLLIMIAPDLPSDTATAAAELGRRIDGGLLDYPDAITANTRDVWLVTVGGELPGSAALAAMHRSIGYEHPDQNFHHLELPAELDPAMAASAVTAMLGGGGRLAVRDHGRGPVVRRRVIRDEFSDAPAWSAESGVFDEVVITGTGAVGLHYARYLAEHGARRIVLLSRRGVDSGRLAALGAQHNVEIVAPTCDITDPAQVSAVAAESAHGGASLVIHTAANATMAARRRITGTAARDTFAAKVCGAGNLVATWPLRPHARILLCSSVSGLWGGYGHAGYAAANRLLDGLAAELRAAGRHCTSVRWGLWPGSGIISAEEIDRVERSGLQPMDPARAVAASLRDHVGDPLIFAADADRLRTFLGTEDREETGIRESTTLSDTTAAVRVALGSVLKLSDTTRLDLDASLLDLGVDSLLALDLRKKLKKATGSAVPLATILGGASASELIEHLDRSEKETLTRD